MQFSFTKFSTGFRIYLTSFILAIILCSCGGGSGGSGNSTPASVTDLGVLPNNSTVYVSASNYTVSSTSGSTTGTIGIAGGTSGYSGTLTTNVTNLNQLASSSDLPTVSLSPNPCILIAGNPAKSFCTLTISVSATVANGTYSITPSFTPTNSPESSITLDSFTVTVTNNPGPIAGSLKIVLDKESVQIGESSFATVILDNSAGISNVSVSIISNNSNILTESPTNCTLSSTSNTCTIHYTGVAIGSTSLNISANGYTTINSNTILVNPAIGHLIVNLAHNTILYNESTEATISLVGSTDVESFTATITSSNESIATINESSCLLSTLNPTCQVNVIANQESGATSIRVSAINYEESSVTLQVNPISSGHLVLNIPNSALIYNESTQATISLVGSSGVGSFNTTITSSNESIATVNESSCTLSSSTTTCPVTILAKQVPGSSNISVSATNYAESSVTIQVVNNSVPLIVDTGSNGDAYNEMFITITICGPGGPSDCQTIDHIFVDTGSTGLRVNASVLTLNSLNPVLYESNQVYLCKLYPDMYQFGPEAYTNLIIGSEVATNVPMQILDDENLYNTPDDCAGSGSTNFILDYIGANGMIGINVVASQNNGRSIIYSSPDSVNFTQLNPTNVPLLNVNPIIRFLRDNNGAILTLPPVPIESTYVAGTLTFGINTLSNNSVTNSVNKLLGNPSNTSGGNGNFKIHDNVQGYDGEGLFDSGTNADSFYSNPQIAQCQNESFFCPTPESIYIWNVTAYNYNSQSIPAVAIIESIYNPNYNGYDAAFPGYGSPAGSSSLSIYGFPFFLGRSVYLGFDNVESTALGSSPAWGYTNR